MSSINTEKLKRTKLACYTAYFTMSSIFSLPPLLFVTFREMYGISYTLLGTLVLINFFTQLSVDLIFTAFSRYFNTKIIVRVMPLITALGLSVYAIFPMISPDHAYVGLCIGTVIFSVSAGLSEVLLSPVIAAIPSETPGKDMSFLHSLYAFGVFTVVLVSTLFLKIFGTENWMYLTLFLATWPIAAAVLFMTSPMPDMKDEAAAVSVERSRTRTVGLILCVLCIFFGSCAENVMSNWISGYMETALHIDKALGDILGVAMFAILLGIARISYAKFGKNIMRVLILGMSGAAACYIIAALSTSVAVSFIACILTGLASAMLWPGTLIMMEENVPNVGVTAFALMASAGDLGASLAPQLMGIVTDTVSSSRLAIDLAEGMNITAEEIGLKAGMLTTSVFPIIGTVILIFIIKHFKRQNMKQKTQD